MTFQFYTTIPGSSHDPSDDQPGMLQNNVAAAAIIAIDHIGYNAPINNGFHTTTHLVDWAASGPMTPDPPAVLGTNEVYGKTVTPNATVTSPNVQLFSQTANAQILQLTGLLNPNALITDGYAWAGGLLFQWGTVSGTLNNETSSSVTFKDRVPGAIAFPNYCFNVQATLTINGVAPPSGPGSISIIQSTVTRKAFTWQANRLVGTGTFNGFFWFAVGL